MNTRTKLALGLLLAGALAALSACNTVKGVGRDIESAAESTEEALSDAFYGD